MMPISATATWMNWKKNKGFRLYVECACISVLMAETGIYEI